jgi:hypothetical protein
MDLLYLDALIALCPEGLAWTMSGYVDPVDSDDHLPSANQRDDADQRKDPGMEKDSRDFEECDDCERLWRGRRRCAEKLKPRFTMNLWTILSSRNSETIMVYIFINSRRAIPFQLDVKF